MTYFMKLWEKCNTYGKVQTILEFAILSVSCLVDEYPFAGASKQGCTSSWDHQIEDKNFGYNTEMLNRKITQSMSK